MPFYEIALITMVIIFTVVCLFTDLRWRRIPNWLTVPAFAVGVLTHTVCGGWTGLKFSLLGFGTGFGLLLALWLIGGGGGGDVKMMGALGAWLGVTLTVKIFLATAVIAVTIVWAIMLYEFFFPARSDRKRNAGRAKGSAESTSIGGRRKVPYAVPMAISTWFFLAIAIKDGALLP